MKRSFIISVNRVTAAVKTVSDIAYRDHLSLYAAQASFFMIMSMFPFTIAMLAILQNVSPDNEEAVLAFLASSSIPELLKTAITTLIENTRTTATTALVPLTAITSLWSASRGIYAVGDGIYEVYGIPKRRSYLLGRVLFLIYTAVFSAVLVITLLLIPFGESIYSAIAEHFPVIERLLSFLMKRRYLILLLFLAVFFFALYYFSTKNTVKRTKEAIGRYRAISHIPGAVFSSVGWVGFTFFYTLYLRYFPRASYIYGSLAAALFLLLWMYSCMNILLWGAELNKLISSGDWRNITSLFIKPPKERDYKNDKNTRSGRNRGNED